METDLLANLHSIELSLIKASWVLALDLSNLPISRAHRGFCNGFPNTELRHLRGSGSSAAAENATITS